MIWKRINKTLAFFIHVQGAIMMNKALAVEAEKVKAYAIPEARAYGGSLKYQSAEPQPTSRLHLHAAGPMHIGQSAQH
jgi:hypothetical protein